MAVKDVKQKRLKERRCKLGYSQTQMAKKTGMCLKTYWSKEVGDTDITIEEAFKIAEILGTDVISLFG